MKEIDTCHMAYFEKYGLNTTIKMCMDYLKQFQ